MTTFDDLGLGEDILKAVAEKGYTTPTPIQEQAIPTILMGRDVLGCAQTGTGKTAGFTLPMIEILANGRARARMPRSLILEPTRELAAQVADNFITYGKYHKLSMALLIGGETMDEQIKKLDRGVDVLIATPGRMLDLFERGKIMLNDIKVFVIDEADRMLDMGFIPDIERISGLLPKIRQTLFFSATMAPEIRKLADRFLDNPKAITVAPPASAATTVAQSIVKTTPKQKRGILRTLLRKEDVQNAFIFCNRKRDVAMLHSSLQRHGFNAGALHGDMVQSKRTETLDLFKKNEINILVCSDVAARGIDISGVSHVFNFDVPFNAEDYVHRIGRTGRAGKSGTSVMLVTEDEGKCLVAIESLIKTKIPVQETQLSAEEANYVAQIPDRAGRGERRGRRERPQRSGEQRASLNEVKEEREQNRTPRFAPRSEPRAEKRFERPARMAEDDHEVSAPGFGDHLPNFLARRPKSRAR